MAGPCIVTGLMAEGWAEGPARQYLAEKALCRRSRTRDRESCRSPCPNRLNSIDVNTLAHEANHEAEHDECPTSGRQL